MASEIQSFTEARPFVGRTREMEAVGEALEEALAGRGRLVVLVGEPGIGKTRLADETAAAAGRQGVPVLWGRCWEAGGAPAYWPWLEVLAGLGRSLDDEQLREALGEGAPLVAELVPALRARLGVQDVVMPPTADEARFRLWRSVASLVRTAATPSGLVIVLEDLHAADEPSLVLLHALVRELRPTRTLIVASYRDVEARLSAAVGALLDRIGREGLTLALGRLDRDAAASFLRQRVGEAAPEVEAQIFRSTQGNPLFLEEMARLLTEAGAAAVAAGDVPHGVREAIGQRLARVPAGARPLLDLAAVAGDELDARLLADAAGAPLAAVEATLAEATRAGVVVDRGGRRRFYHALVREVLDRELAPERRRTLHGQVAAALERTSGSVAELAHHLIAGPPEGLPRAVEFSVRASQRALGTFGYEEAVAILARAAEAVEVAGNQAHLRAPMLLAMAEARIRRGESEAAKILCRDVATLARGLADTDLLARAALTYGQVWAFAMVDPVLVGLLEEALEALPPGDSPLRVRLMARLGAALQPAPRGEEPIRIVREAIAGARRIGDPPTLLGALFSGMSAMMFVADPRERLPLNLEAEQLCTLLGDRERLLHTQMRLVMDHMELGELPTVQARIEAFEALAREMRAPWYGWRATLFRSMVALVHGRFAEAEQLWNEVSQHSQEAKDAAKDHDVVRCCAFHREGILRASEQHDAMLAFDPTVRRAKAGDYRASALQSAGSALIHARREDEENTRLYLALIPDEMRPPVDFVYGSFFLAEPAALVGTVELCGRLRELLLPSAANDVTLGLTYMTWEGPVARLVALLAERMGRTDEADARFAAALARTEQLDAGPYLARTRYEYGRALQARGDRERARNLLGSARELGARLGLTGLVALADRRLGTLGAGTVAPVATAISFSMAREGDYWTLAHGGALVRLKDSLGLQYLARLVAEPGREVHVLELMGGRRGGEAGAVDTGDAGELLDPEARDSYRRRLEDLEEELGEAESFADAERASRLREEIDFLGAELGRAVGLGGRSRRAGSSAERARSAVQRRIKNALERVEEHDRALAAYLARAVKTGNFCVFRAPA